MTDAPAPTPRERCARARDLVGTDAQEAFRELRPALAYPSPLDDETLRDALDAMRVVAKAIAGDGLASVVGWARDHLDDTEALYDAGYAFYEHGLHDLAATLLDRANRISPGSTTIVTELSANLEALLMHADAAAVLTASGLAEGDPMCAYLLGYNAFLSGDVETARRLAERVAAVAEEPLTYMSEALSGMVARAVALRAGTKLDDRDLAGWHLAINGAVLSHLSPHGYDAPMRGRYAYVGDRYELVREGIERLAWVLSAAGIAPARVFAMPDRSSAIVALAAAKILGVPCEPFTGGESREGVVVAYDLDQVGAAEALEHLRDHRPGQVLFAHASSWTDPFPYAPDVTTFLYQTNVAPWDEGQMRWDPEAQKAVKSEADTAPLEEIAERVVAARADHESVSTRDDLTRLVAAAKGIDEQAAIGLFRSEGQRLRQRAGSAVKSARFA
jgi:tetratricopeptide (TPR) repeat protein